MLKFRSKSNGVQTLSNFIHNFRHLLLYSTSSSTSISISAEANPNFANYLVEYLGFTKQQALSTSTKLVRYRHSRGTKSFSDFNFIQNADSVVKYLKQIGLEQSHIRNTIVCAPKVLLCKVDKTLICKNEVFQKMGFSGSDFADIVKVDPSLIFTSLNNGIVPAIQALREILDCDSDVIAFFKKSRGKWLYSISRYLVPNVALLRSYGIPIESIRKYLLWSPSSFLRKTEFFEGAVLKIEEKLGIPRHAAQFLAGVRLFTSYSEKSIESKQNIFKSFGWTESNAVTLFRQNPTILVFSEDGIKKKLGFLMNELGYEPSFLATKCSLFTYSLEKRIVPRHKVLLVLKEKGLIRMESSLVSAVTLVESQFLMRYVLPYKEVHDVYSKHAGMSLEMLTQRLLKKNSDTA